MEEGFQVPRRTISAVSFAMMDIAAVSVILSPVSSWASRKFHWKPCLEHY